MDPRCNLRSSFCLQNEPAGLDYFMQCPYSHRPLYVHQMDAGNVTSSSSDSSSSDNDKRYEMPHVPSVSYEPSGNYSDFVRKCLAGCEIGESLATSHQSRPCFKKIDSLFARIKQDLTRSDNVLANINSQGIPWAIKDFLFAYTRVINTWSIMKGYVYETPDGLSKIQSILSKDFQANFFKWENVTHDFLDSLIDSATNLDEYHQKNVYHKFDGAKSKEKSNTFYTNDRINQLSLSNTSEANGQYFKVGVHSPLQKGNTSPNASGQHERSPPSPAVITKNRLIDDSELITYLVEKLSNMDEIKYFFWTTFIPNYFPDLLKIVPNFIDFRSIMNRSLSGGYKLIKDAVHDVEMLINGVKLYLKEQQDDEFCMKMIRKIETQFTGILAEDKFNGRI